MSVFSTFIKKLEAPTTDMMITASQRVGSHIQRVTLTLPQGQMKEFSIGSYIQPMVGGVVPRAYSIAETDNRSCTIIVSFSGGGVGGRFFRDARVGDVVSIYGPFDDFPYHYSTGRPKIFMATGTGVAPFVRMVPEAMNEHRSTVLVLGVPHREDIPYASYFYDVAKKNGSIFAFVPVLSAPDAAWEGERGYVTDIWQGREKMLLQSDVYICGVPPMVAGAEEFLKHIGMDPSHTFIQKFG